MSFSYLQVVVLLAVACVACAASNSPCRSEANVALNDTRGKVTAARTDLAQDRDGKEFWRWVRRQELPVAKQTSETSSLELRLTEIGCTPQEVLVKVSLHNRSKNWLWVHTASVSGMGASLNFAVIDTRNGTRIEQSSKSGHVSALTDYVILSPDGAVSRPVPVLRRFSSAADGGLWKIGATYRDTSIEVPEPPEGTRWFSGEVESNVIEVSVPINGSDAACRIVAP